MTLISGAGVVGSVARLLFLLREVFAYHGGVAEIHIPLPWSAEEQPTCSG